MRIVLTVREISDIYMWDEVCELRGINVYAKKMGLISSDEEFSFDEPEIKKLNLMSKLKFLVSTAKN